MEQLAGMYKSKEEKIQNKNHPTAQLVQHQMTEWVTMRWPLGTPGPLKCLFGQNYFLKLAATTLKPHAMGT